MTNVNTWYSWNIDDASSLGSSSLGKPFLGKKNVVNRAPAASTESHVGVWTLQSGGGGASNGIANCQNGFFPPLKLAKKKRFWAPFGANIHQKRKNFLAQNAEENLTFWWGPQTQSGPL